MTFETVASVTTSEVGTSEGLTITIDGTNCTGRIANFMPGQVLQMFDTDHSPANISDALVVARVDYVDKKVTLVKLKGSGDADFSASDISVESDGTYVGLYTGSASGTCPSGPSGIETWLVSSGSDVFGFNLGNHPQFKSLVAAVNGVLDEATLNKYVGGFFDAYGAMYGLDSVMTTTGVLTAYMEAIDGLYRYQRQGERLTLHEGWASMDYAWQGQQFEIMASRYIYPETVYIHKTRDQNIKRYGLPKYGTQTSGFPGGIDFVAPLLGSSTIFMPTRQSDDIIQFAQAPFNIFREWCPDQLPGVKLTAVTELNP
jgi:hypothetical protein